MDVRVHRQDLRAHCVHHHAFGDLVRDSRERSQVVVDRAFVFSAQATQIAPAEVNLDLGERPSKLLRLDPRQAGRPQNRTKLRNRRNQNLIPSPVIRFQLSKCPFSGSRRRLIRYNNIHKVINGIFRISQSLSAVTPLEGSADTCDRLRPGSCCLGPDSALAPVGPRSSSYCHRVRQIYHYPERGSRRPAVAPRPRCLARSPALHWANGHG
jgi:hypothetical protein